MVVTFITGNLKDCLAKLNYIRTPNYSITSNLSYDGTKQRLEFNKRCLKQDSVTFNQKK